MSSDLTRRASRLCRVRVGLRQAGGLGFARIASGREAGGREQQRAEGFELVLNAVQRPNKKQQAVIRIAVFCERYIF